MRITSLPISHRPPTRAPPMVARWPKTGIGRSKSERPASLQPALWGPARPGAACPPMRANLLPQGGAAPGHASRPPLRAVAVGSGVGVVDVAGRGGVAVLVRPADVVGQEAVHETGSGAPRPAASVRSGWMRSTIELVVRGERPSPARR